MTPKNKVGCILGILSLLVVSPIWYYLLYQILKAIGASDVMWLLFWIYIPVALLTNLIREIAKSVFDEEK